MEYTMRSYTKLPPTTADFKTYEIPWESREFG